MVEADRIISAVNCTSYVSEDIFNSGLTYTGHSRDYVLDIKGLDSSNGGMKVPITAAKQINTTASVGLDDIIRT